VPRPLFVRWHIFGNRIRISFVAGVFRKPGFIRNVSLWMPLWLALVMLGTPLEFWGAQGQNPPPQDISFSISGNITEKSPGKLTIDSGQNMLFTVKYDSATSLQHADGNPAKVSELRVGVKILAKGILTEAGDVIAKTITIETGSKSPEK
jgi:hypothetical protein